MAQTSQMVATFILNAIWQITAITTLALLCTKLLHRAPSRFSHRVVQLRLDQACWCAEDRRRVLTYIMIAAAEQLRGGGAYGG